MPFTSFPNEIVLYTYQTQRGTEILVQTDHMRTGGRQFVAISREGHTDYPIRYSDGRVAWDRPEAFTSNFRKRTAGVITRIAKEAHAN